MPVFRVFSPLITIDKERGSFTKRQVLFQVVLASRFILKIQWFLHY